MDKFITKIYLTSGRQFNEDDIYYEIKRNFITELFDFLLYIYTMNYELPPQSFKDFFVSYDDLFIPKKAYTPTLGTMRQKGSCKVHIKY